METDADGSSCILSGKRDFQPLGRVSEGLSFESDAAIGNRNRSDATNGKLKKLTSSRSTPCIIFGHMHATLISRSVRASAPRVLFSANFTVSRPSDFVDIDIIP